MCIAGIVELYRRFEESRQIKIPDTINSDDTVYGVFCLPNDPEWFSIIRGMFSSLTRGRYWKRDDREGSIKAVQETATEIEDSLMICNLDEKLDAIVTAITAQNNMINVGCCLPLTPPDLPSGGDYGDFPNAPTSGDYPIPEWDNESPTYNDHLCMLFNAFYKNLYDLVAFVESLDWVLLGATAIVGLLAIVFPEPVTTVIGTITLASVAGALATAVLWQEAVEETFAQLKIVMHENGQEWLCQARELSTLADTLQSIVDSFIEEALTLADVNNVPSWVIEAVLGVYNSGEYVATWLMQWHEGYLSDIGTAPDGGIDWLCRLAVCARAISSRRASYGKRQIVRASVN